MLPQISSLKHAQTAESVENKSPLVAHEDSPRLPERITRSASKQAYYTIRLLADHDRMRAAFCAYAYFRWVDDWLDRPVSVQSERLAFIERQRWLVYCGYSGEQPGDLAPQERLLLELIRSDAKEQSGLRSYIRNMMAVMSFDANRRGRLISQQELTQYTLDLSVAVTDALHYFIGHRQLPPQSDDRYLAAQAAHITHMLRDTFEDIAAGYFNIPGEVLTANGISASDIESGCYRDWVRSRVQLARDYFRAGAQYLDAVKSLRCRIAGYAYMARFVGVLDAIEREGYCLRPEYPEFKRIGYGIRVGSSVCVRALRGIR